MLATLSLMSACALSTGRAPEEEETDAGETDAQPSSADAGTTDASEVQTDAGHEVDCPDEERGLYCLDLDKDGFGGDYCRNGCPRRGYVLREDQESDEPDDCDDDNDATHPGAEELCDGVDNDCDPSTTEAAAAHVYYVDADHDGFGGNIEYPLGCGQEVPEGVPVVDNHSDCDDLRTDRAPNQPEVCDGVDNDCDYLIDNADPNLQGGVIAYPDYDGDTFGYNDPNSETDGHKFCLTRDGELPQEVDGWSLEDGDDIDGVSTDFDSSVHPNAHEICDGRDNDGDGVIDDGVQIHCCRDADLDANGDPTGDGDGDPNDCVDVCECSEGYVQNDRDCDPNDIDKNQADHDHDLVTSCQGDCDDWDRTASTLIVSCFDGDRDGYGDCHAGDPNPDNFLVIGCHVPAHFNVQTGDCNDGNDGIHPGATEICGDGVDQNCQAGDLVCTPADAGVVDSGTPVDSGTGTADSGAPVDAGVVDTGVHPDAAAGDTGVHPDAAAPADAGVMDSGTDGGVIVNLPNVDDDGDGFTENQGDCDDTRRAIHPGRTDACQDGIDLNGDGDINDPGERFDLNCNGIWAGDETDRRHCSPTNKITCSINGSQMTAVVKTAIAREDRLNPERGTGQPVPNPVDPWITRVEVSSNLATTVGSQSTTCADPAASCGATAYLGPTSSSEHSMTFARPAWFVPRLKTNENGATHAYELDVTYMMVENLGGVICELMNDPVFGFVFRVR